MNHNVKIHKPGPNCLATPPDVHADPDDTVTYQPEIDACLDFKSQENWPFTGSYAKIDLVNGMDKQFTVATPGCGTEVTYSFHLACVRCQSVTLEDILAGAGKMIVRR